MNMVGVLLQAHLDEYILLDNEDLDFLSDLKLDYKGNPINLSEEDVTKICNLYDEWIVEAGLEGKIK